VTLRILRMPILVESAARILGAPDDEADA